MARRNDHTQQELTALTLEKVNLFLENRPYQDLSLRKIATMVGYAPSTLVKLFGNYNLLLLEVVGQALEDLTKECEAIIHADLSPIDTLSQLAYTYHRFALNNPYRWHLVFEHQMYGKNLPDHAKHRIDRVMGLLEYQVTRITPEEMPKEKIIEISRVIWGGVHGLTMLSLEDKFFASEPIDGQKLIENFLSNYFIKWQS